MGPETDGFSRRRCNKKEDGQTFETTSLSAIFAPLVIAKTVGGDLI